MDDILHCNEEQLQAVTFSQRVPLLVLAGPGSGKTFTILNRLSFLLKTIEIPAAQIVVITFTRAAANQLGARFRAMTRSDEAASVFFGTFHSYFYHILVRTHTIKPNHFFTQKEKEKLLKSVICDERLSQTQRDKLSDMDCQELLQSFSDYKNTLKEETIGKLFIEEQAQGRCLFEAYEQGRKRLGKYDYDDLLYDCYCLFRENPAVRRQWGEYTKAILCDEFQDINPVQYEVLKMLFTPDTYITAVGDDDQSIYGFRGSEPSLMRRFEEELDAKTVTLNANYRCCDRILAAARQVIEENENRFSKELYSVCNASGQLVVTGYEDALEQYLEIGKKASARKGENALLFRTNATLEKAAGLLKHCGYPIECKEMEDSYSFLREDMLQYLRWSRDVNNMPVSPLINKPNRFVSREHLAGFEEMTLPQAIRWYRDKADMRYAKTQEALCLLQKQLETASSLSLYPALLYIRKVVGYDRYLAERAAGSREAYEDHVKMLDTLCRCWKQCESLEELESLNWQKETPKSDYALRLMTIHRAKGLEFDNVWLPDCNEGILPYASLLNPEFSKETLEEERRIFYVGMTRARTYLELTYVLPSKTAPRPVSRFVSPFLTE